MGLKLRMLLVALLASGFALGFGGAAFAQQTGSTDPMEDCVEDVLDLPALNVCKDAQGRHLMELPAIGVLREPTPTTAPTGGGKALPKTGVDVKDFAAVGLAALAGGTVLLRRLRLSVA